MVDFFLFRLKPFRPLWQEGLGFRPPVLSSSPYRHLYHLWLFRDERLAKSVAHHTERKTPSDLIYVARVSQFAAIERTGEFLPPTKIAEAFAKGRTIGRAVASQPPSEQAAQRQREKSSLVPRTEARSQDQAVQKDSQPQAGNYGWTSGRSESLPGPNPESKLEANRVTARKDGTRPPTLEQL